MNLRTHVPDSLEMRGLQASSLDKEKLTRERWQEILRYREEFFSDRVGDPRQRGCLDREVVESWVRSRQMGVNPHAVRTIPDDNRLAELRGKHQLLIQAVLALINPLKSVLVSQGYLLYLVDRSGLVLLDEGVWSESETLARGTSRSGILADERSEGTTAHELCFRLKRPVQLLGPEHYCSAFQNRIASAAPMMGEDGEAVAALVIFSPPLLDSLEVEDRNISSLYLSSLKMVSALAMAAEMLLRQRESGSAQNAAHHQIEKLRSDLHNAKEKLVSMHKALAAALAFIEDGTVVVDPAGKVLQVNPEAIRIFKARPEEIGNHNISEFLGSESTLMKRALSGKSFVTDECINLGFGKPRSYRIYAHPILSQYTKALDVTVLKFVSQEKALEPASSRSGASASYNFADILGDSREIKATIAQAQRYANSLGNILLLGESGTGKELFAQSIHNVCRPKGPFMAVNCAALPHELVGSELFGYEGGSFTGAERCGRPGKIELAHGGTLFLDEIGDIPLDHQATLLRTLEDKKVMRVGGSRYKDVDFRLVAATNKDLAKMVRENTFREDLFYRISVLTLQIPPLRKRGQDIAMLAGVFVENYCQKQGWKVPTISPAVMKMLQEYAWPGNIRQLQNALHHAINTIEGNTILPGDLPHYILGEIGPAASLNMLSPLAAPAGGTLSLKEIEKAAIEAALLMRSNCIQSAAASVGLSRSTLYRKIKEYNINIGTPLVEPEPAPGAGRHPVARRRR